MASLRRYALNKASHKDLQSNFHIPTSRRNYDDANEFNIKSSFFLYISFGVVVAL